MWRRMVVGWCSLWCMQAWAVAPWPGPLVDDAWLAEHRQEVVILDVGSSPQSFVDTPDYLAPDASGQRPVLEVAGHVPGAVLTDPAGLRVERQVRGASGEATLLMQAPGPTEFERWVRRWGINQGDDIVLVPRGQSSDDVLVAARLYWIFKRYGQTRVALLNGGTLGWLNAGRPVSSEPPLTPVPGNWQAVEASARHTLGASELAAALPPGPPPRAGRVAKVPQAAQEKPARQGLQVIDARATAEYAAGHLAGAASWPPELLTQRQGYEVRFASPASYRQELRQRGIDPDRPTALYCTGGKLSPGAWFVLSELLGNADSRVFEGGVRQWQLEQRPLYATPPADTSARPPAKAPR